jgi:hypothetical protein
MTTVAGKRSLAVKWTNDVEQIDGRAVHQLPFIARDLSQPQDRQHRIIERA